MDETLAAELARMVEEDQRIRQPRAEDAMRQLLTTEESMEIARVDVANADRLREIVDEHGWPGRSLVGVDGANDAWLLAQHADRQLDFQRRALALLEQAVVAGEATPRQLAYLTDRVRMNEGREQVYGTQIAGVGDDGGIPWPVEDPDRLDERRAAVGLPPFAEYAANWRGMRATA